MKRKVKVTKVPKYGEGHTGDQQNYGLYRGGGNLKDYLTGTEDASDEDIRVYYPEDKANANVEVEQGELIKDSQGIYKVGGKKHSQGGHKVNVEPGAYVFSDYITMHPSLQVAFGFDASSKKKKDNTIATLLNKKIDVKDYNRNMEIIRKAELGEDVDQYALNTAMNRIPDYNKYISRAALAGELSKALIGKDYEIPELGMPALQELQGQSRDEAASAQPMSEMRYGGMQKMQGGGGPKKIKKSELSTFLQQNPGYTQDPANPNRYVKTGTPASKGTRTVKIVGQGSYQPGYSVSGSGQGNVTVEDIINNPNKYKTFHERMKGAPDDVKKKAAEDLYAKGVMPAQWVPGKEEEKIEEYDVPGTPSEEVLIEDVPGTTGSFTDTTPRRSTPPQFTYGQRQYPRNIFQQDLLNLVSAGTDYTTDVYPTRQGIAPVSIDPAFLQPDYAPIQSIANQQSREASLYARGPQTQSAVFADIQGRTLPALAQLQGAIGAQNIQTDMGARQFNAQAFMQAQQANTALGRQYLEDVARFVDSADKERISKKRNVKNAVNQLITNAGNASLFNQMFPQAAYDPWSYSLYMKPGSGRTSSEVFGPGSSSGTPNASGIISQIEAQLNNLGLTDEQKKAYREGLLKYYMPSPTSTRKGVMNPALFNMMSMSGAGAANPAFMQQLLMQGAMNED